MNNNVSYENFGWIARSKKSGYTGMITRVFKETGQVQVLERVFPFSYTTYDNIDQLEILSETPNDTVNPVELALGILRSHMEDKAPGELYSAWKDNISMSIQDTIKGISKEYADKAAERFLESLLS